MIQGRLRAKLQHPTNFRAYLMRQHGRLQRIHEQYLDQEGGALYAGRIDTILKQIEAVVSQLDAE